MNLYHVKDAELPLFVVAASWHDALKAWEDKVRAEMGSEVDEEVEPPQGIDFVCDGDELLLPPSPPATELQAKLAAAEKTVADWEWLRTEHRAITDRARRFEAERDRLAIEIKTANDALPAYMRSPDSGNLAGAIRRLQNQLTDAVGSSEAAIARAEAAEAARDKAHAAMALHSAAWRRADAERDAATSELRAVMVSVDKWLDSDGNQGGDLAENPATRAARAREVALKWGEAAIKRAEDAEAKLAAANAGIVRLRNHLKIACKHQGDQHLIRTVDMVDALEGLLAAGAAKGM